MNDPIDQAEKKPVTLLVGAEGVSEQEGQPWLREATPDEIDAFAATLPPDVKLRDVTIDGVGRPYFVMTVLPDAPAEIYGYASRYQRVKRLTA
jgi:hypothetical protein